MDEALAEQTRLYGASLRELVGRVLSTLDLNQAGVARVLGVSAPMLSQLLTGARIKFGNPQAVERLRMLLELCDRVEGGLAFESVAARLEEIRGDTGSSLIRRAAPGPDAPAAVSALLRAVASGRELVEAADLLEPRHPELATLLRVYGTGTEPQARAHYAALGHLLDGRG